MSIDFSQFAEIRYKFDKLLDELKQLYFLTLLLTYKVHYMKSNTYSKVNALSIKTRSPADLRSEVKKMTIL